MLDIEIKSLTNWGSEGNGKIIVKNNSTESISNWSVIVTLNNFQIKELWNFNFSNNGNVYTILPKEWQYTMQPGSSIESNFSYIGSENFDYKLEPTPTPEPTPEPQPIPELIIDPIAHSGKKVIGYFTEWSIYQRKFSVEQIDAKNLTHISYAFMLPNPNQADYELFKSKSAFSSITISSSS